MQVAGEWRCGGDGSGKVDDDGAPVIAGLRKGDDEVRLDEGRTKVAATWSQAARSGVGKRPEKLRTPARRGGIVAVAPLR